MAIRDCVYIDNLPPIVVTPLLRPSGYLTTTTIGANTVYVALLKSDQTELSGGSYARVQATVESDSNTTAITFPAATGTWSEAVYVQLYSASSGGTAYLPTPVALASPLTVTSGQTARFAIGTLNWVTKAVTNGIG